MMAAMATLPAQWPGAARGALLSLLLAGCAAGPQASRTDTAAAEPPPAVESPSADAPGAEAAAEGPEAPSLDPQIAIRYARAWVETNRLIKAGKFNDAYPRLSDLMASALFDELPSSERHTWLQAAARLGAAQEDYKHAHPLFVTASELPEAVREDWEGRYDAALRLRDTEDATQAITTIARRWPVALTEYNNIPIRRLAMGFGQVKADEDSRLALLEALYAAKWKIDFGVEPSGLWQELARILTERGKTDVAADVAGHITDPRDVLALRVDNRFDVLVRAQPQRFEMATLVEQNLTDWRTIAANNPMKLLATSELAARALDFGRYDEALRITDGVLTKVSAKKPSDKLYDDLDNEINWIRDTRAHTLMRLGRWDEAEREMRLAASLLEDGRPNVSNTINFAMYQIRRGRPAEALRTLGPNLRSGKGVSGYGAMQVQAVMHAAAVQTKDAKASKAALDYLREHQIESVGTFQEALLFASREDEAAALVRQRLANREQRSDALVQLQEYRESQLASTYDKKVRDAWRALRQREDVRAAVAQVGRIEQVPLPPQ